MLTLVSLLEWMCSSVRGHSTRVEYTLFEKVTFECVVQSMMEVV